ncbi:Myb-like DNA-binding domain containing protein [Tritrichomonas foetus]|uniref:Myb-like DNA-binding domain containing protein n=1 Tax=Tritrichomonas foetus TaxID=1144522 RepID=A0A1J4K5M4_9EUKA|nr:Myb-like DNA-binding domain containing protein [Tritrichomonas foetus]|eukprot:OHT06753.1 Myb-like DNA-binding domain containing protein [Tritrichomonas foetus]
MNTTTKRNKFTKEEDKKLAKLVKTYGEKSWKTISKIMVDRTERQCRERWRYFLSPKVQNKKSWTVEEDDLLLIKYAEYGPKWSTLSKFFRKRSDVSVKNRYHILIRDSQKNNYFDSPHRENHKKSTQPSKAPRRHHETINVGSTNYVYTVSSNYNHGFPTFNMNECNLLSTIPQHSQNDYSQASSEEDMAMNKLVSTDSFEDDIENSSPNPYLKFIRNQRRKVIIELPSPISMLNV